MFSAIGKLFRAIGYLFTGKVDAKRQELSKNPAVIQATYDRIVGEKKARIQQYKDAVARMITQEEKKLAKLRSLTDEVNHLEKLKEGAAAKAKLVVNQLKAQGMGMGPDQEQRRLHALPVGVQRLLLHAPGKAGAHRRSSRATSATSAATSRTTRSSSSNCSARSTRSRRRPPRPSRDVITSSKEEEEIADMLSGISDDRTSKELDEMRDLRNQSKAQARVSREMAGHRHRGPGA